MRVGFTGTRKGMSVNQWSRFEKELLSHSVSEWHDGDCVGADDQAHRTVKRLSIQLQEFSPVLHGHPCNLEKFRAYNDFDVMNEVLPPLVRNRIIVDSVDLMFAAPMEYTEVFRGSGTWATIRYALKKERPLCIIWPDGKVKKWHFPQTLA